MRAPPTRDEILAILDDVKDPEIPVISVVELGIVRDVTVSDAGVVVTITPTYSGCPAMHEIEADIARALQEHGITPVEVRTTYSPAWTTDWIGGEARAKLAAYGIAPPRRSQQSELVTLSRRSSPIPCPFCHSIETERKSEFGSTACKAIWFCRSCRQPFEEFKAL
ncbi:MAG TPA: 1,2-phenylacetyl-CoA epoxidase subunit PaaD [Gemmatimonadaceae bacterium]|nr:1,2-phenylacetyl-CoA epoxidase subunit PaaD [Gemmatimonadaceae bacterium]